MVVQNAVQGRAEPVLPSFTSGLQPQYRYLLVQPLDGLPAVYVLGAEHVSPQGLWEAWYSKDGAFIETVNGQLINLRAYGAQWSSGGWHVRNNHAVRSRDVLGAQLFSVVDVVAAQPAQTADLPLSFTAWLNQHAPGHTRWQWVSHMYQTTPTQASVPQAWFATGTHRSVQWVVASYQCTSTSLCLRMLRWPVTEVNPE